MASDVTSDSSSRFSIFVPKPFTRINLGKPDMDSPFGYKGLSMQADANMFVDINKVVIFQSWKDVCFQAIGKWTQWADGALFLGSVANTTLTAGNKLLLVAGASQSRDMLLDHGMSHVTPRIVEYNNLELHYRIEEIHNGLKKLFYGDNWKTAESKPQQAQDNDHKGGYADGFLKSLHDLLVVFDYGDAAKKPLLQPLEWEGDYLDMKYGDSSTFSALRAFDPYAPQGFSGPFTKAFAYIVATVAKMKRFVDVMRRIALAVTDNALMKRIQSLFTAWGNAQDGFNSILNSADIARFDRDTGKPGAYHKYGAFHDEANQLPKMYVAPSAPTPAVPATAAELHSLAGPFDISRVSATNAIVQVRDVRSGAQQTVDFSPFLSARKATISIPVSDQLRSIAISTTGVAQPPTPSTPTDPNQPVSTTTETGTLTLDGVAVTFTRTSTITATVADGQIVSVGSVQTTEAWGALPQGFQANATNTLVSKSDGSAFSASGARGISVTDATFSATDTLSLVIDGTPYAIPLDINALPDSTAVGSDRAAKLATAIDGQHAGAATASGNVVTIQSDKVGISAQIQAYAAAAVMTKLGMSGQISAAGEAQGQVSAADLAGKLSGVGAFSATVSGAKVTLTHRDTGSTSFIEVAGAPLATTFFGADPATAQGTDGKDEEAVDFWQRLSDMRNLQFEMAKWPENVRNLFRPVTDALNDIVSGIDKWKGVIDNAIALIAGTPKSMALGLIAKDSITLGTSGAMYGAGGSITFVAVPPSDPDEDKFVLLEKPVKWLLEKEFGATQWVPSAEDLQKMFKPTPKKAGHKQLGDFRVVAQRDIFMAARSQARVVAVDEARVEATAVHVQSKSNTFVTSRLGDVRIRGKNIQLGDLTDTDGTADPGDASKGKQVATQSIILHSKADFDVVTTTSRIKLDDKGGKILLGKTQAAPPPAPPASPDIDDAKPHLSIAVDGGARALLGFVEAAGETGFAVEANGELKATAKSKLTLGVPNDAGVTIGSGAVAVAGKLKVGTALLVTGDGVFTAAAAARMSHTQTRRLAIPGEYAAIMVRARAAATAIVAADQLITAAVTAVGLGLASRAERRAGRAAYDRALAQRNTAEATLIQAKNDRDQLISEAHRYRMRKADYGRNEPTDSNVFVVPIVLPRP